MKLLVPYLFLWTTVLAGLVKPQASAPKLTAKELEYLTDDPEVTHRITFEITHRKKTGLEVLGSLTMALFGTVVPKTAENFAQLSSMTPGYGYEQMIFHRVINNFMIQGGDFEHRRGTGGKSIYDGGKFDDENFELKHNKMGRISMANSGPNTNGAQFFITNVIDLAGLDGKHVVFGQLIGGFDTLVKISTVPVDKNNNMPLEEVFVSNIKVETMQEESKEEATFAASAAVSDQDAPQYEEIDPSSNFYTYFFLILLIGGILFYYNQWHHRKQHVTDIKDSAYF